MLALSTGCADFLDERNETRITVNEIYTTSEGISNASVGLYYLHRRILRFPGNNDSEMFAGLIRGTDIEVSRIGPLGSPAFGFYRPEELNRYRYLQTYWNLYYEIIGKANEIVFYGEELEDKDFAAERAIAEARYFRAISLLFLYERFNNIYLNTTPTTPENFNEPRTYVPATKQEVFNQIFEDLDLAIQALPLDDMGQPGRITRGAARHVKMLSALWMEDWQEAIQQGEAIAASGQYSLMPLNQLFSTVKYINHPEAIATWQYFEDLGGSDFQGQFGFAGHRAKALFVPEYHRVNNGQRVAVNGGHGRAWLFPNPYLLSLYDQENDQRYSQFYRHAYFFTDPIAAAAAGREVGDTIPPTGNIQADFQNIHVGLRKFEDVESYPLNDSKGFGDVIQYRYAQTCISLAEAYLKAGDQSKALEWFNQTWVRAGNEPRTDFLTMQDILDEHARELALEGHRWAFLKRTGTMVDQIRNFAGEEGYNIEARTNFQPFNVNWPIPQGQLDIFGPSFPQNDGFPR